MSKKWDAILEGEDEEVSAATGDGASGNRYAYAHKLARHIAFVGDVLAGFAALVVVGIIGQKLMMDGGGMFPWRVVVLTSILVGMIAGFIRMVLHGVAAILRAVADTASTNAEILEALKSR